MITNALPVPLMAPVTVPVSVACWFVKVKVTVDGDGMPPETTTSEADGAEYPGGTLSEFTLM